AAGRWSRQGGLSARLAALGGRLWRRRLTRVLTVTTTMLVMCVPPAELWLERRDLRRIVAEETFARLDGANVRYRLTGSDLPGHPIVFLNGMGAALEQFHEAQEDLATLA